MNSLSGKMSELIHTEKIKYIRIKKYNELIKQ